MTQKQILNVIDRQREEEQLGPGETQPRMIRPEEFNGICGGCHNAIDGTELGMADLLPASQKTPRAHLPGGTAEQFVDSGTPFKEAKQRVLDTFESAYLRALLEKHGGNISRSAQSAGLTRYHLRELAKRYGLRES